MQLLVVLLALWLSLLQAQPRSGPDCQADNPYLLQADNPYLLQADNPYLLQAEVQTKNYRLGA
jgi:hypothetical protein